MSPDEFDDIETELADSETPAEKPKEGSWAKALEKSWDEVAERDVGEQFEAEDARAAAAETDESGRELAELFSPHREQLKAEGHTPGSYQRMLVGFAQLLSTHPNETAEAIRSGQSGAIAREISMRMEYDHFAKTHPDAEALRQQMGQVLLAKSQRAGETTLAALKRAYDSVKPAPKKKAKKPRPGQAGWEDAASAAWDEVTY